MKIIRILVPVAAMLGACASYPAPTERMARSQSAVRAAEEVGGQSDPHAALYLQLAQEELAQAKQLMNDGDNRRADYLLLRSDADAELAIALTRSAAVRIEADRAIAEVLAIRAQQKGQNP